MPWIARERGLTPVPVDLDPAALRIAPAAWGSTGGDVRALVVAQLFGGRAPLAELAATCWRRGWLLIEDCLRAKNAAGVRTTANVGIESQPARLAGALSEEPLRSLQAARANRRFPQGNGAGATP